MSEQITYVDEKGRVIKVEDAALTDAFAQLRANELLRAELRVAEAVAAERERCARIAAKHLRRTIPLTVNHDIVRDIEKDIRSGAEP